MKRGCANIKKKVKVLDAAVIHINIFLFLLFKGLLFYFFVVHFDYIAVFINICMCLAFLLIVIVPYWRICLKGRTTFIIHILICLWLWQREIVRKAQTSCKQTQYMTTNLQARTTLCYFGSRVPYWSGSPFYTHENDHYRQVFVCYLNAFYWHLLKNLLINVISIVKFTA